MSAHTPRSMRWLRGWMALALAALLALATLLAVSPTAGRDATPTAAATFDVAAAGAWYCPAQEVLEPSLPDLVGEFDVEPTPGPTATASPEATEAPSAAATPDLVQDPSGGAARVALERARVLAARIPEGQQPAAITTRALGRDGGVQSVGEVFPGSAQPLAAEPRAGVEVRWQQAPVEVHQLATIDEDPGGVVAAPCASTVSRVWTVPGMSTADGAWVTLRITNPLAQDAAVAVRGFTPLGLEDPRQLRNLSVPSGTTMVVDVNRFMPQLPDLSLEVEALTGRIAVDGVATLVPTVSGVAGRAAVQALPDRALRWYVPWVSSAGRSDGRGAPTAAATATEGPTPTTTAEATSTGEATSEPPGDEATTDPIVDATDDPLDIVVEGDAQAASWLWITNGDAERPATVTVSWLTSRGRVQADVLGQLEVSPQSVRRIDLAELLPDLPGDVGVDIEVTNDVPVAVSAGVVVDDGDSATRTGWAMTPGSTTADTTLSASGVHAPRREHWLTIANPFGEPTTVDLAVFDGITSQRPGVLQGIRVNAGGTVAVDLSEWARGTTTFTVFVAAADGGVVANLRGLQASGRLDFASSLAVGPSLWAARVPQVAVDHEAGMVNRLGTGVGGAIEAPSTEQPAPTVPPGTPEPDSTTPTTGPAGPAGDSPSPSPESGSSPTATPTPTPSASP